METLEYKTCSKCDGCGAFGAVFRQEVWTTSVKLEAVEKWHCCYCLSPLGTEPLNESNFSKWVNNLRIDRKVTPSDLVHPNPYIRKEAKKWEIGS